MAQTHLPPQWRERILAILNSHGWDTGSFAHEAMRFLAAWSQAEGGTAKWNPLNSTSNIVQDGVSWCLSPDYNTIPVRNYATPIKGEMATVATLLDGNYNGIVGFLQAPAITAEAACTKYAAEIRTWGTDPQLMLNCLRTISSTTLGGLILQ